MTTKLISKYADILQQMENEAVENVKHAHNDLKQKREDQKLAKGELKRIEDVMDDNHHGFWEAAKTIIKMIFKRPDNPKEIEHMLVPIINYKNALEAVPAAKTACEDTMKAEQNSVAECTKAEKFLNIVRDIKKL